MNLKEVLDLKGRGVFGLKCNRCDVFGLNGRGRDVLGSEHRGCDAVHVFRFHTSFESNKSGIQAVGFETLLAAPIRLENGPKETQNGPKLSIH